jgi:uncharacterized coiled-coil DUF342 family protein
MTITDSRQDQRLDVVERLRELAKFARQNRSTGATTGAQVLDDLAAAVNANGGAALAGVDLPAVYPPDVLLPDRRSKLLIWLLVVLRWVRDVLVFTPIGYTWWSLWQALNAFGAVARTPAGKDGFVDPGPFLTGWQRGTFGKDAHGHATKFDSLGTTAEVVTVLVCGIILCVALVSIMDAIVDEVYSNATKRQELGELLAQATFIIQPTTDQLSGSLGQMTQFAQRLETSTKRMVDALSTVSREIKAAVEGGPADRIEEAMNAWVLKAEQFEDLLKAVKVPAETLESFEQLQQSISDDQQRLGNEIAKIVRQVQSARAEMANQSDATWTLKDKLADELGNRFDGLASRFDASGNNLRSSLHQLTQLVTDVGRFVEVAERTVRRIQPDQGDSRP